MPLSTGIGTGLGFGGITRDTSVQNILELETGDNFLLETGDYFLTE